MADYSREKFDAIVVGGGLGGLIVGGILAKNERVRVLVLEKEKDVGGRMHHFIGENIRTPDDYLGTIKAFSGSLTQSIPDLETIIDRKLLTGYRFELGMHDIVNGQHSRVVQVLNALGESVEIVPLRACGIWHRDKLYTMTRGQMPWMDREAYAEMRAIIGEMIKMSIPEIRANHRLSLAEYLETRTKNPTVLEFLDILGAFTVGMNSSKELSAGEFILVTRMPMLGGLHFADGTLGQMGGDGFMEIAHKLTNVIRANGGEVRTGVIAEEILVANGRVAGVRVKTEREPVELQAATVVCNVPIQVALMRNLLPRQHLSKEFIAQVEGFESSGAVTPIFGLKKSVIDIPGMLMTKIDIDDPAFPNGVMYGYEAHSLFIEGKAPEGSEIIEGWIGLRTSDIRELKSSGKIKLLNESILKFMKKSHPGFEEALEWALFPAYDFITTVAPTPEQAWDRQLSPRSADVDGLFFVGEAVKNYGKFMDGVAYGALLCVDAITGKSYMHDILPAHQREI